MVQHKRVNIGCLIVGMAGFFSSSLYGITVDNLGTYVRSNNAEVRSSQKEIEATGYGVDAAKARYYPSLELKNRFTHLKEDITIELGTFNLPLGGGRVMPLTPPPIGVQNQEFKSSAFQLTQPIYAGGQIAAGVDIAKAAEEEAKFGASKQYEEQLALAYERYFQVVQAMESRKILQKMGEQLDRLYKIGESLVSSGSAPKLSLMKIDVTREELKSRQKEAENKEMLARLALRSVLSASDEEIAKIESPLRLVRTSRSESELKEMALSKRSEWGILDAKRKRIDGAKRFQTGGMKPKLYAFGRYEMIPEDQTMLEPRWAVGVGLDIPLTAALTQMPERAKLSAMQDQIERIQNLPMLQFLQDLK
jgi:outer membrane protein TolC